MVDRSTVSAGACVADTMVLAMFVDAGHAALLVALAAGRLQVTPSVIDPSEVPPFAEQPVAEFARGIFAAQRDLAHPLLALRVQRRTEFYRSIGTMWHPVSLSADELQRTRYVASAAARAAARFVNPSLRVKRIGAGEAEAAAVAIARRWTLWSDDTAIVNLLAALFPDQPVERVSDLVIRAAGEGLLDCQEAVDLYNDVFRDTLGLWTTRTLVCAGGQVSVKG